MRDRGVSVLHCAKMRGCRGCRHFLARRRVAAKLPVCSTSLHCCRGGSAYILLHESKFPAGLLAARVQTGAEARAMALNHVTLDDKYDLSKSRIFVTGFQAIVRLCLMQKELDRRAGLNTAGYVTGYR